MTAGAKAVTGQKLHPDVLAVYKAAGGAIQEGVKAEVKQQVKAEVKQGVKRECSSPAGPSKALKPCLSSPSQIASLYACSSSHIKVIPNRHTQEA